MEIEVSDAAFPLIDAMAFLAIAVFIVFGLAIPLGSLGAQFFRHVSDLWDPEILDAARITAFQASVSAGISTIAGVAIALALPRDSRLVRALLGVPFGIPAVAAATAWVLCLPRMLSYSLTAVIIAHVFFNIPWVALWISRALDEVSVSELEAAKTLGASPARAFRSIIAPVIAPASAAVFAQVFSLCAMSFILVMILGGGPPVDTLETTLFAKIRTGGLDLSGAGACAVWQILITLLPWLLLRSFGKTRTLDGGRASRTRRKTSWPRIVFGVGIALVFVLPYLALAFHVLSGGEKAGSFSEVIPAFLISVRISVGTAFFSTVIAILGIWMEERSPHFARWGSPALVLPAGISVMVLGLGFFVAYGRILDPFSASLAPIVALEAMFFVPVAFRALQPIARARNAAAWDAALTLGASPISAFHFIEWPRWRGPIAGVLALIAGASFGEVAAVSLFYNESRVPASLLISRWMGRYRFEDAQMLSVLLMAASAALIFSGMWVGFEEAEFRHE